MLLNSAGDRLRFLGMTRYPFPRPDSAIVERIGKSRRTYTETKPAFGVTRGKTTVVLTHPFLPELDFVDMTRGHLVELCRQCFIHVVPFSDTQQLKSSRRSAPPRLLLRGHRVILQIPFHSPNGVVSAEVLGGREYTTKAGADRGLRVPVALSVEKDTEFVDLFISVDSLMRKRMTLRRKASVLQSEVDRRKNNWKKKHSGQAYPRFLFRKMRHLEATWRKLRRLDHEIARIIASKTVWFCEQHRVKRMFFEDLRSFRAHAGSRDLSWNLSSNLWGKVIETVRYMRESLGHSPYSVWTVNPRYTSQTCHFCGERGVRVEDERSTAERRGGEYFYCSICDEHSYADINAAGNIIYVQDRASSVVPGRTA